MQYVFRFIQYYPSKASDSMSSKKHIKRQDRELIIFCLKGLHFILSVVLFYFLWIYNRGESWRFQSNASIRYDIIVLVFYSAILLLFFRTYNSYLLGYTRIRSLVLSEFISQIFSVIIICIFTAVVWDMTYNMWSLFLLAVSQGILDVVWAYWSNRYYYVLYPTKKAILIYRDIQDKQRFDSLSGKPSEKLYKIEKEICYTGNSFSDLKDTLEEFEVIFVAGIDSRCRNGIAKYCMEKNVIGYFIPHIGDIIMQGAIHIQSFDTPIMYLSRKHLAPEYKYLKRLFDLSVSTIGLLVLSPFMIVIAAIIRISDGGSAIYKQERLTKNGALFKIYKFRTMCVDAENDGIARLSTGDDDVRVTRIGRFLRRFRLDELPQLYNILKGDMSFVGPRPERPEIAKEYYESLPGFSLRLQVKAGLTGYAQVYGRYNSDPYEQLQFDLMYINHMGFLTDIKLMFATISTFFSNKSTEGVNADIAKESNKPDKEFI